MLLIEDGAQGFGGRIGSRKACSFGDIATTSFFPAKPLGCYGDGGAIFTNHDEIAKLCGRVLCLPMHPYLEEREIDEAADALKDALNGHE